MPTEPAGRIVKTETARTERNRRTAEPKIGNDQTKPRRKRDRKSTTANEPPTGSSVIKLKGGEAELDGLLSQESYVLLKFTATFCKPCRDIQPTFEKLAASLADDVASVVIDVEENPTITDRYPTTDSIPAFVLLRKGGEVVSTHNGGGSERLKTWIAETMKAEAASRQTAYEM